MDQEDTHYSDGSSGTGSGPIAGQGPCRQKVWLVVCRLSETKELLCSCTHHFVPRASAVKQAELGDPMTQQKGRGAWNQAGMGWKEKGSCLGEKPLLNDQKV